MGKADYLFPDLTAEEIHRRIQRNWDFTHPVPVPRKGHLGCGSCGSTELQGRSWEFFVYPFNNEHRIHFRVNVSLKCTWCGHVGTWGVPITEEYYNKNWRNGGNWRKVRQLLEEADNANGG